MIALTTAEILYHRPDYRWLLQTYCWQDFDIYPRFPKLMDFLKFWEDELEGPLFRVTVACRGLQKPVCIRAAEHHSTLS